MEIGYNYYLVGLSFAISVFGSYTALQLATGIPGAKGKQLFFWLGGGATALGGAGIWSMHFIGMIAYEIPMEINYDLGLTVLSLILAIVVVGIGLYVVGNSKGKALSLVASGFLTGIGVALMHYIGMASMQMEGIISYDYSLVALSLTIAIVASIVALWLAFNLRGNWQRFGSALVMGTAVCGMHYSGMAAVTMTTADSAHNILALGASPDLETLASSIFFGAVAFLAIMLFASHSILKQMDAYTYTKQ